jgi:fatty acid-binding protein DegV
VVAEFPLIDLVVPGKLKLFQRSRRFERVAAKLIATIQKKGAGLDLDEGYCARIEDPD